MSSSWDTSAEKSRSTLSTPMGRPWSTMGTPRKVTRSLSTLLAPVLFKKRGSLLASGTT